MEHDAIGGASSGADLCTLARSIFRDISRATAGDATLTLHVDEVVEGQTVLDDGVLVAGTSDPVDSINPSFYPVATKDSECAALVTSLSWADRNLRAGYEWCNTWDGTKKIYFVSGILNSSQTDANDPFTQSTVQEAACWDMDYEQGVFIDS